MNFLRKNWFDIGGGLAFFFIIGLVFFYPHLTKYQFIMWVSLVSLFLHQLEEYRIVGTFPGMINTVLFKSEIPDRYPLNMNSAFYINVFIGWLSYFLAAVFAEKAVWLGFATILISLGNTIAHTIIFNARGKTFYNAGMATCWLLFAPVIFYFFKIIIENHIATLTDWITGFVLGILLNYVGILKMIDWMKDKNTPYIFPIRFMKKKNIVSINSLKQEIKV